MSKKINQQVVLARFRARHGDLYDYRKVRYRKMIVKVKIVCSMHGTFLQTPDKHLQGTRCPRCMIGVAARLRKAEAASEFKQKATAVHGNKYNYSDVTYTGNKKNCYCVPSARKISANADESSLRLWLSQVRTNQNRNVS